MPASQSSSPARTASIRARMLNNQPVLRQVPKIIQRYRNGAEALSLLRHDQVLGSQPIERLAQWCIGKAICCAENLDPELGVRRNLAVEYIAPQLLIGLLGQRHGCLRRVHRRADAMHCILSAHT